MIGPEVALSDSRSEGAVFVAVRKEILNSPCFIGGFGGSNASTSISPSILRF